MRYEISRISTRTKPVKPSAISLLRGTLDIFHVRIFLRNPVFRVKVRRGHAFGDSRCCGRLSGKSEARPWVRFRTIMGAGIQSA